MRFFRFLVASLWLLALGLAAAPAHALGTFTKSPPQWAKRQNDLRIDYLNRRDCLDDVVATFSVAIRGVSSGVFEVWSGDGCNDEAKRSATASPRTCVLATTSSITATSVEVHFRDMIKPYTQTDAATEAVCDSVTGAGLQNRTLYFVVYDSSSLASLIADGTNTWNFNYDVTAPPPPTNVTAQSGDTSLVTSFTAPSGETDLLHYRFYCSRVGTPPADAASASTGAGGAASASTSSNTPGAGGAGGAGGATGSTDTTSSDTAGASATSGTTDTVSETDANCTSSTLVPGQPVPDGAMECGVIGAQGATGGETDPVLGNDEPWVVAVAAEDTVNNVGVLSNLACNTPKDIVGFYEAYRKAGGAAGGGYCAFGRSGRDGAAFVAALLLGACALWRRRK